MNLAADPRTLIAAKPGEPLIVLEGVTKTYQRGTLAVEVLHGVSLTIKKGAFVAIMGASGSGKTTLMNILGCLDRPTGGRYLLNGREIGNLDRDELALLRRHTFGFIFQQYNLLATADAIENVEIPAAYAGLPRGQRLARAQAILAGLGLGDRFDHRPHQLSGGPQQRVSIARALMNGGAIILADEPTGALDSRSGREVLALLHQLNANGHTIILITHDPRIAAEAREIVTLADGVVVSKTENPRPSETEGAAMRLPPFETRGPAGALTDLAEAMKMAFRALKANLFRTVLTLLGIVIGVGSVVAMLALGDGAKKEVLARIQAMGTNLLLVRPGAPNLRFASGGVATLIPDDALEIAKVANVRVAVPEMGGGVTLRYGNADYQTVTTATSADYPLARDWPMAKGIFFTQDDVQSYVPVVALGQTVVDNLFPAGTDPIGRYVLMNNVPFQVIGVMGIKGATPFGSDMDDAAFVPLTTGSLRLFGQRHLRSVTVQVDSVEAMAETQRAITELLIARHRVQDFQIRNMAAVLDTATQTQNTMTLLLGSIAAISLVVGGIG
ncbi:MAG: ABC transporter permease, partial [Rhodospirillales bacterium]|nr:ABC transporter permease [Rhodospirillales bacterium]